MLYQKPAVNQGLGRQIRAAEEVAAGGQNLSEHVGDAGGQKEVLGEQVHEGKDQHLPQGQGKLMPVEQQPRERVTCRGRGYINKCTYNLVAESRSAKR